MSETITTNAREGIQTLSTVGAEPVGWDDCEDMPEAYGHACAELTAETLTRAGMLVLGVLGDTDLVYMEGDEVCVGLVTPPPSQLIDVTKEDVEKTLEALGYDTRIRGEVLDLGGFAKISDKIPEIQNADL